MGSLTSRPKVPSVPQIQTVYVPAPAATSVATPVTQAPSSATPDDAPVPTPETARQQSLLGRSRGRLSTVLTGFRGILDDSTRSSGHKTLLGE
jgi:hypothetical protein